MSFSKVITRIHGKVDRYLFQMRANSWNIQRSCLCQSISKGSREGISDDLDLSSFPLEHIRNFSIVAHVDHGKSTLADRILELTGAIKTNSNNKQVLDKLQVERERGITVKAQTASIVYEYNDKKYLLNLIDTPGHVDFTYEVSRSLAACQGAVLLIDANEGVQAQTVANFYLAFTNELAIVPVINKIDLKNANPEDVKEQLLNLFEIDPDKVLMISAKLGTNVTHVIEAVIKDVPSPEKKCKIRAPLRALLFDSWFNRYRGVVCLILVVDGTLRKGDFVTSSHSGKSYEVKDLGILVPQETPVPQLFTGQVGYFTANIRAAKEAQIGDTFHLKGASCEPLEGFKSAKPMVFAGVYPMDQKEHPALKAAIERLCLNDGSVSVTTESSSALGQGWRLGFLGLLHMDVFSQRLEQEHGAQVITTTPSVPYKIKVHGERAKREFCGEETIITNPSSWPDPCNIVETSEPYVMGTIITPDIYLGEVIGLCQGRRGIQQNTRNLDQSRIIMQYKLPMNEIVVDFYDALKSLSSGYATFDYEEMGFEPSHLVKRFFCFEVGVGSPALLQSRVTKDLLSVVNNGERLLELTIPNHHIHQRWLETYFEFMFELDILLNGHAVLELSTIIHASQARAVGKKICEKLKDVLPRQLFQIAIQAAVGGKILARTNIQAVRKDVLSKCYGGDITRKMKLLKHQAEGKKRMKMYGNIEVPRETFINILKR